MNHGSFMKRRRSGAVGLLVLVLAFVAQGVFAPDADAHQQDQSYLYLDVGERLFARVQMSFTDIEDVLGLPLMSERRQANDYIAESEQLLIDYALEHTQLSDADGVWELTPTGVRRVGRHVEVAFDVDHAVDFTTFTARFDPFLQEIEDRDALLIVASDLRRGIVDNEQSHLVRFTASTPVQDVDLGDPIRWKNFTSGVELGIDHIRTGPDHILFIVALVLPAVLVYRDGWRPAPRFVSSLWRTTKLMTMFTLAHSVTFSLAGLGIVPQPSGKLVESVIALSIVATALHNIQPVFREREWLIAFVFGLFHGFGFASLVGELEVDRTTELLSLLGRNVGIEIGQLYVVALAFPALFLLRRFHLYRHFLVICSLLLAAVGLLWTYERLTESERDIARRIESWVEYPRVLWFVLALTVVAALGRWGAERFRPTLLVSDESSSPAPSPSPSPVLT